MSTEFVHLHCHTQFSMLDGSIRLKGLVNQVAEMGMGSVAVTDHANMFGAVQLVGACKGAGIKPIIGCEVNLVGGERGDEQIRDYHHLVLLAASQQGYHNLVRIVSRGWVEGLVHGVPRVDFALLREHREGVVGMSACMGGYLAQQILRRGPAAGRSAMAALRDCFDPGFFFVELQDHGFPEQGPLNEILVELARDLDVPIVASNDCHYPTRDGSRSQLVLQCIGAGRSLEEMERLHHGSEEIYLKSPEEMAQRFSPPSRGHHQHAARLRDVRRGGRSAVGAEAAGLQRAVGAERSGLSEGAVSEGARSALRRDEGAEDQVRSRGLRGSPGGGARGHHLDGLPGLLPDRSGLHQLGEGATACRWARAAAPVRARSSPTRCASPTSTRCPTACSSSAS